MTDRDEAKQSKTARGCRCAQLHPDQHNPLEYRDCAITTLQEALLDSLKREEALEELAERSTRRLVELSTLGSIGAFAARDAAVERAEQAEARLKSLVEKAEAVLWLAKHEAVPEDSVTMQALRAELDKLKAE